MHLHDTEVVSRTAFRADASNRLLRCGCLDGPQTLTDWHTFLK